MSLHVQTDATLFALVPAAQAYHPQANHLLHLENGGSVEGLGLATHVCIGEFDHDLLGMVVDSQTLARCAWKN